MTSGSSSDENAAGENEFVVPWYNIYFLFHCYQQGLVQKGHSKVMQLKVKCELTYSLYMSSAKFEKEHPLSEMQLQERTKAMSHGRTIKLRADYLEKLQEARNNELIAALPNRKAQNEKEQKKTSKTRKRKIHEQPHAMTLRLRTGYEAQEKATVLKRFQHFKEKLEKIKNKKVQPVRSQATKDVKEKLKNKEEQPETSQALRSRMKDSTPKIARMEYEQEQPAKSDESDENSDD